MFRITENNKHKKFAGIKFYLTSELNYSNCDLSDAKRAAWQLSTLEINPSKSFRFLISTRP
jgi:beta-lactamase class D